jgi:hypothetical protein
MVTIVSAAAQRSAGDQDKGIKRRANWKSGAPGHPPLDPKTGKEVGDSRRTKAAE